MPEASMALPERDAAPQECAVYEAMKQLYTTNNYAIADLWAPEIMYTSPTGDVVVGKNAVVTHFAHTNKMKSVEQRLLQTPELLPARTMVMDQLRPDGTRSLLVVKRRALDGLVTSITEEENHCKAVASSAPHATNNVFHSPTDNMLSPCTSKLNLTKRRHYMKGKPTNLFVDLANRQV